MPALVQSTDESLAERAHALGAAFLHKHSPWLLEELRRFIQTSLGFGDFVFVNPATGVEVARVPDLAGMAKTLRTVRARRCATMHRGTTFPTGAWARTEFALAARIRPWKVSDFKDVEELQPTSSKRSPSCNSEARRGVVADFASREFERAFRLRADRHRVDGR